MRIELKQSIDKYAGGLGIVILRPLTILLGILLRRNHELAVRKEIVWIKMLGGGSLMMAMPVFLGFREKYPNTRMVLITTPGLVPFAELAGFDEYRVIADDRGFVALFMSSLRVMLQTLFADCIVDLEVYSRLTTVFATLTLARNRVSFWLEDIFWRKGLSSHLVFFNRSSGSFYFYEQIGSLFGATAASQQECREHLARTCGADTGAKPASGKVAIGFACSDMGRERMLMPEQWVAAFRDHLREGLREFVFLGAPRDRADAETLIVRLREAFPSFSFINRCGDYALRDSVKEIFAAEEFWGIDSGLLHVARAAGIPCVSWWGPTDPATRLASGWGVDRAVHYRKIACSPCVHVAEAPPCRGDNRCIKGLFKPEDSPEGWTPVEMPKVRKPWF